MISVGTLPPKSLCESGWHDRFSAELVDGIAEAILTPDPAERGAAICELLEEVLASVAWLDTGLVNGELASLRRVVDEANTHRAWLSNAVGAASHTSVSQAS